MATLSKRNGLYYVRFIYPLGQRHTLALHTRSERQATLFKLRLENLISSRKGGVSADPETIVWLGGLSNAALSKFAEAQLIEPTAGSIVRPTLGSFLTAYFAKRSDVKPATRINWGHTRRNLVDFFGENKPLDEINAADAKDFERYLKGTAREHRYGEMEKEEPLSPDTVRKRISNAKQFFSDAVDAELVARNPFAKLKSAVLGNRDRQFFITRAVIERILTKCPDDEWRLLVALARYGGLRTPSESLSLRWDEIDWDHERMTVHSPKTEHHEGKESRVVPLFPELRPHLVTARKKADGEAIYVIGRWRDVIDGKDGGWKNCNLRTHFERIIKKAGVKPWPKLWQNLRSSRQTELEESFPSHVVCQWVGNSERVARRHYLQVTEDHFARATGARSTFVATDALECVPSGQADEENIVKSANASQCLVNQVGGTGFEPVTSAV